MRLVGSADLAKHGACGVQRQAWLLRFGQDCPFDIVSALGLRGRPRRHSLAALPALGRACVGRALGGVRIALSGQSDDVGDIRLVLLGASFGFHGVGRSCNSILCGWPRCIRQRVLFMLAQGSLSRIALCSQAAQPSCAMYAQTAFLSSAVVGRILLSELAGLFMFWHLLGCAMCCAYPEPIRSQTT